MRLMPVASYALEGPCRMPDIQERFEGLQVGRTVTTRREESIIFTVEAELENGAWIRETWEEVGYSRDKWLVWVEEVSI